MRPPASTDSCCDHVVELVMAGISPAMTREYKETLVVPQFEFDRPSRTEASRHDCPHVCGFTVFGAFRRGLFNGSRAYARCRDVWHIPRHGMGHAEQRRPLPRSCKRYSRMHVVARWPHRELHRAAEKFKLRHYPKIENFRCLMTRSFLRCTSQTARFRSKSALN